MGGHNNVLSQAELEKISVEWYTLEEVFECGPDLDAESLKHLGVWWNNDNRSTLQGMPYLDVP